MIKYLFIFFISFCFFFVLVSYKPREDGNKKEGILTIDNTSINADIIKALKKKRKKKRSLKTVLKIFKKKERFNARKWAERTAQMENLEKVKKFGNILNYFSEKYDIPKKYVYALPCVESGGNPKLRNRSGAIGLWQVKGSTAKEMGINPKKLLDPRQNIAAGIKYFKFCYTQFNDWDNAIIAYNIGHNKVAKLKKANKFKKSNYAFLKKVKEVSRLYEES